MISILMPAYNAERTIAQAVRSVLGQQGAEFELIVVDDGSTDATADVVCAITAGDSRVKFIQQENRGTGGALATATAHAEGEWLLRLDADDWLTEGSLACRVTFMHEHPGYDIYSASCIYIEDECESEGSAAQRVFPGWQEPRSVTFTQEVDFPWIQVTSLFRRDLSEQIGSFRPQFYNEDYDLWLRLLAAGARHLHQPEPLAFYRIHQGQKTDDVLKQRADDCAIFNDLLASGALTDEQAIHVQAVIKRHKRNIALRKTLYVIIGRERAEVAIRKIQGDPCIEI
ncbi:MAG: glycosyltransferase [Coriobacteriia bacterium]|nr:glycosyltransferase [Coriobacteriia bacterium]